VNEFVSNKWIFIVVERFTPGQAGLFNAKKSPTHQK
jgi:hypothetical protein